MASSSNKGAAEEPEPEPGPPSPSLFPAVTAGAAAAYNPREYQPAHPDDRGGGDGKPAKKGGGAKGKGKGEGGAVAKGKGGDNEDDGTHRCGNCDAPDAKSKCKGCGVEYYCNRECQTVGLRLWVGSTPGARRGGGDARAHRHLHRATPAPHPHPPRSTGSTAATRRPAPPTSSPPPPRRSRTGSARRRTRPTSASSASSRRASPRRCRAGTRSARGAWRSCG